MLWLEWVAQSGTFIPYQPRGSVTCRPFPFPLPMPGMSNVKYAPPTCLPPPFTLLQCVLNDSMV